MFIYKKVKSLSGRGYTKIDLVKKDTFIRNCYTVTRL